MDRIGQDRRVCVPIFVFSVVIKHLGGKGGILGGLYFQRRWSTMFKNAEKNRRDKYQEWIPNHSLPLQPQPLPLPYPVLCTPFPLYYYHAFYYYCYNNMQYLGDGGSNEEDRAQDTHHRSDGENLAVVVVVG
jgi:hypothetical protein